MQIIHENHVFLKQRTTFQIFQFGKGFGNSLTGQMRIEARQGIPQRCFMERFMVIPFKIRTIDIVIAKRGSENLQYGIFIITF